jgi:hypothetical protein
MASSNTQSALAHLMALKPYDGWTVDVYTSTSGSTLNMLCRRNAPIAEEGFVEIYYDKDASGCVVGILTSDQSNGRVLVEADGHVARTKRDMRITRPSILKSAADGFNSVLEKQQKERERRRGHAQDQQASEQTQCPSITDEQNTRLIQAAGAAMFIAAMIKILASALFGLSVLLIPAFIYANQTVPTNESFDAKKELKRVLRGYHLAEDDPRKPKGWLEQTIAKVQATVTTEVSTSFGYELEMINLMNFATLACTRVPAAKVDCYWVGAFGKWRYLTLRSIPEREKED